MKITGILSLLFVLAIGTVCRGDLHVQTLQPNRQDRFYAGADKDFLGQAFNWSGVGQSNATYPTWVTMISPEYFLSAYHFQPSSGDLVTFFENNDPSGPSHQFTVANWGFQTSYNGLPSDLWLGKLTSPIPASDNITYYPVLGLPSADDYVGKMIYVNGKPNRVGRNVIDRITTAQEVNQFGVTVKDTVSMEYDYNTGSSGLGADECYLIAYDSGGPSFVDCNGQLALVGIHYYNTGALGANYPNLDISGDSFVPYYVDQLDANMGGESVSIVPEPSTAMLLIAGAATLWAAAWRHRKRAA